MIWGEDSLELNVVVVDICGKFLDVLEERRKLDHDALAALLEHEHLVVDEVVGLISVEFNVPEVVDANAALAEILFCVVRFLHFLFLSVEFYWLVNCLKRRLELSVAIRK